MPVIPTGKAQHRPFGPHVAFPLPGHTQVQTRGDAWLWPAPAADLTGFVSSEITVAGPRTTVDRRKVDLCHHCDHSDSLFTNPQSLLPITDPNLPS